MQTRFHALLYLEVSVVEPSAEGFTLVHSGIVPVRF